eukprot:5920499-Pyramimonas_sp.AAC.1
MQNKVTSVRVLILFILNEEEFITRSARDRWVVGLIPTIRRLGPEAPPPNTGELCVSPGSARGRLGKGTFYLCDSDRPPGADYRTD